MQFLNEGLLSRGKIGYNHYDFMLHTIVSHYMAMIHE